MAESQVTEEQVLHWISTAMFPLETLAAWFAEVLSGEYTVEQAREDCLSVQPAPAASAQGGGDGR